MNLTIPPRLLSPLLSLAPEPGTELTTDPMANMPCHAGGAEMSASMLTVETASGEQVMIMGGMPLWMFLAAVTAILLFSFVLVEILGSRSHGKDRRINLIAHPFIYSLVRNRWFQAVPQLMMVVVFFFLIYAGLFGNRIGNITPVAVWTIWWGGLVFMVAVMGPAFCFACPWDGLANLASRLSIARKTQSISLGLKVPKTFRNMYPAIALFTLLTWAELGLGVTSDPRSTAYMGISMAVLAVGCALLFNKKTFCAHLCPVGRISGMYANFAPIELRAKDPKVCATCKTQECLRGGGDGYACPTGISLKVVNNATMCTLCTECVKSCDKNNVAFNIRPFARDLYQKMRTRPDESWMCISLLALTLFHGFSMTTAWEDFTPGNNSLLRWMDVTLGTPHAFNFTVGMIIVCSIPVVLYVLSGFLAERMTRGSGITARTMFLHYAYSLLPVALFYHLSHNLMHILMEGGAIVPMLSDPLNIGWNLFGTADMQLGHLVSDTVTWYLQILLIVIGHLVGIVVAHRTSRRLFSDRKMAVRSLLPMLAIMVLVSTAGLSLMVLDMNMRVGRI